MGDSMKVIRNVLIMIVKIAVVIGLIALGIIVGLGIRS